MSPDSDAWRDRAACLGADLAVFFPEKTGNGILDPARAICKPCPVRVQCLRDAQSTPDRYGVFGGLDAAERRELRKKSTPKGAA